MTTPVEKDGRRCDTILTQMNAWRGFSNSGITQHLLEIGGQFMLFENWRDAEWESEVPEAPEGSLATLRATRLQPGDRVVLIWCEDLDDGPIVAWRAFLGGTSDTEPDAAGTDEQSFVRYLRAWGVALGAPDPTCTTPLPPPEPNGSGASEHRCEEMTEGDE